MPVHHFARDGLSLAFLDEGAGRPVLLIHGFASNHGVNWVGTGWIKTLTGVRRPVTAIDNPGPGPSDAVYYPAANTTDTMSSVASPPLAHLAPRCAASIA